MFYTKINSDLHIIRTGYITSCEHLVIAMFFQ